MTVITCTATDALGVTATTTVTPTIGSTVNDGSANAPVGGIIHHPHLLDVNSPGTQEFGKKYITRPSWKVAGVDYGVGPPSSTVFKIPGVSALPAGVSINGTIFQINADNVVIDGWDFTGNGGWSVQAGLVANNLGKNTTIKNCKFKVGSNGLQPIRLFGSDNFGNTANGATISNNIIDGNNVDFGGNSPLVDCGRSGPFVLNYNFIGNAGCDLMDLSADSINSGNKTNIDIRYNVLQQAGQGAGHADWLQTAESDSGVANDGTGALYGIINIEFNTCLQFTSTAQAFTLDANSKVSYSQFGGGSLSNNTVLIIAPGNVSGVFLIADDCSAGPWQGNNNFVDPSGMGTPPNLFVFRERVDFGPFTGPKVFTSGNINLLDGTSLDHSF